MLWFLLACKVDPTPSDVETPVEHVVLYPLEEACLVITHWVDGDRDGYGDPSLPVLACPGIAGLVRNDLDCDDLDALVSPDSLEECDGIDNDCDGVVDGADSYGAILAYPDEDLDGFGVDDDLEVVCELPEDWVLLGGDCDDLESEVNPDALEVVDGVDNDCDGVADDGFVFGDGADGALVVNGSEDLSDHGFACTPVLGFEAGSFVVEDSSSFENGDRALVIDQQGTTTSTRHIGEVEWVDVLAVEEGLLTPLSELEDLGEVDPDLHRLALYRVPSFSSVEVHGQLTAPGWDEGCGGLLVLLASESVEVTGVVEMTGAGFAGGTTNIEPDTSGRAGESWLGLGAKNNKANAGGGGGGGIVVASCPDCESSGGGGGYGDDGVDGERSHPTKGNGGQGGVEYGETDLEHLHLGSGGGAGACDTASEGGIGGAGGAGGGAIWLRAPVVDVGGTLDVRGTDGEGGCAAEDDYCGTGSTSEAGSGGGGSGGSVRVQGDTMAVSTLLLDGGPGAPANDGSEGWAGDGSVGRSRMETVD